MHHTAIGDGDSARYEVILMISFFICHGKQAQRWGAKRRMSDRKARRSKKKEYEKNGGVRADKQVTTAAVA